jgi:hypothetical protein
MATLTTSVWKLLYGPFLQKNDKDYRGIYILMPVVLKKPNICVYW